jgi:peptidoglycan/LPS O-acetylase OafA/YrhL
VHFPGFDALRFYAALSIVIGHTNGNFGEIRSAPANLPVVNLLFLDPQSAVNLFLVLSGFLITYLMLAERAATGTLNIRRFYLRRILRIGPLYYLTVLIGLCLIPWLLSIPVDSSPAGLGRILLILLILPNFTTGVSAVLGHLWCIGLQFQSYLIWPWVTRPPLDRFLKIAAGILIVKIAVTPVILGMNTDSVTNIFYGLRFECIAIGALGAYLSFTRSALLQAAGGLPAQAAALGGMAALAVWDLPLTEPSILLGSCIFLLVILNFSEGSSVARRLEAPVWRGLGKISYGIYMFHYPLLFVLLNAFQRLRFPEGVWYSIGLHAAVIGGSILLAAASYAYFERPFLRWKRNFSTAAPVAIPESGGTATH